MPYKKTYRRNYRKTSYVKPKQTTLQKIGNVAIKGFKIASKIASIINSEKKFKDDYYLPTTVPFATPIVRLMTGIPQGTNDGQRVGNSVSIESMQSKYRIKWGTGTDGEIRHIIFTSKNNQYGSTPEPGQILQDATTPITNMVSPLNKLNRYDYRIIKDEHITQNSQKLVEYKEYYHPFKMTKDAQGNRTVKHHCLFNAAGATDIADGHVFEMWLASGTNPPTVGGYNRIRYYDN